MQEPGSIPTGALPDGWVRSGGELAFQYPAAQVEVRADRRPAHATPSTLGVGHVWAIEYARRVGEATERRTVETATTRRGAAERLCVCMRRVSDASGGRERPPLAALRSADAAGRPPTPEVVDTASYTDSWLGHVDSRE